MERNKSIEKNKEEYGKGGKELPMSKTNDNQKDQCDFVGYEVVLKLGELKDEGSMSGSEITEKIQALEASSPVDYTADSWLFESKDDAEAYFKSKINSLDRRGVEKKPFQVNRLWVRWVELIERYEGEHFVILDKAYPLSYDESSGYVL